MDNCGLPIADINNGFGDVGSSRERQPGEAIEPKRGLVNQVCREWLVHEDGALAYRLQEKEIEMHYGKNREQRKTIRMDIEQAKYLQEEDGEEVEAPLDDHDVELLRQELEDERVAKELQEQIEREEALHNRILEQADKELAKKLQESESRHGNRRRNKSEESHESSRSKELAHSSKKDLATCYEDTLSRATRNWSLENVTAGGPTASSSSSRTSSPNGVSTLSDVEREMKSHGFQSTILSKSLSLPRPEELRRLQEVKDEELALSIQEEEATKTSQYYKDQQLAIEAQDRELAKLLQEKERLRAKKAKQKARAAAAQHKSKSVDGSDESSRSEIAEPEKKPMQKRTQNFFHHRDVASHQSGGETSERPNRRGANARGSASPLLMRSQSHDDRAQHPSAGRGLGLERLPISAARGGDVPNIAMALDPTYYHEYTTIQRKSPDSISPAPVQPSGYHPRSPQTQADVSDEEYGSDEDLSAPPYMPIQGQKRQTIDKRKKKDSCKQQ